MTPLVLYASQRLENINCIVEANMEMGAVFLGDIVCVLRP
jgi:hypothetical protein